MLTVSNATCGMALLLGAMLMMTPEETSLQRWPCETCIAALPRWLPATVLVALAVVSAAFGVFLPEEFIAATG